MYEFSFPGSLEEVLTEYDVFSVADASALGFADVVLGDFTFAPVDTFDWASL